MSDPYDAIDEIGDLYDSVTVYHARRDVAFYVDEARNAKGPVLEIGCGTGRVLIPTARAGATISGLDKSPRMLARCKDRVEAESDETKSRITLNQGDMRDFDLGRKFALATVPFRPLQHLVAIDDQLSALNSIGRHLDPRGRIVFDVFYPNFHFILDPSRAEEREDMAETQLPDGRTLRRTGRVPAVHMADQYSEIELIYYVQHPDGRSERLVQSFPMRWYMKPEIEHLLARCGFRVTDTYGDFDRTPLSDESPEMIFVAERA